MATFWRTLSGVATAALCSATLLSAEENRSLTPSSNPGLEILKDALLFPQELIEGLNLKPFEESGITKVWHAVPAGQGPAMEAIRAKYGTPSRKTQESCPALRSGGMMVITRDVPEPGAVPTRKLEVHYYGLVGFGVVPDDAGQEVAIITNLHSSAGQAPE